MSSLLVDYDVELVELNCQVKSSGSPRYINCTLDYWGASTLTASNNASYPILLESPTCRRSVGTDVAVRHDVSIRLDAYSHFEEYGVSLMDLLKTYELNNAEIRIYYFPRPKDATVTYTEANHLRQVLKVVDYTLDEPSGTLNITARDTWFPDKELSKELSTEYFTTMDPNHDGEVGTFVFGTATDSSKGIVIDCPYIESGISTGVPYARYFAGWGLASHSALATPVVYVRNQHRDVDDREWLECNVSQASTTAVSGSATITADADPPNYNRDLSLMARAKVYRPAAKAEVLSTVQCQISHAPYDRCADIPETAHFSPENPSILSRGAQDFTFSVWIWFDAVSDAGSSRVLINQGAQGETEEWALYFAAANNALKFYISNDGATISKTATWSSNASTSTWYHVVCWFDTDNDKIGISVNNGTAVTTNITGVDYPQRLEGTFFIGDSGNPPSFNGRIRNFMYWTRVLDSTERTTIYNSGSGLQYDDLDEDLQKNLNVVWGLNQPYSPRVARVGSVSLIPHGDPIPYTYSSAPPTITNSHGELSVTIYEVQLNESGTTYTHIGGALRKSTVDITTTGFSAGTNNCYFQISPPLVMSPNVDYAIELDWSNDTTWSHYIRCAYTTGAESSFQRDKRVENAGWEIQTNIQLGMALYILGSYTASTLSIAGSPYLARYFSLSGKAITLSNEQEYLEFAPYLEFKVGVEGPKDDGSGTYTGSASAVISKPADIARFLLMNANLGNQTTTTVDTSTFTTVRGLQNTAGLNAQVRIDQQMTIRDALVELCRHGRMVLYKSRVGKISVYYPTYSAIPTIELREGIQRGEMLVTDVSDDQATNVINDLLAVYAPDLLNEPKDPALIRKTRTNKYSGVFFIQSATSTDTDTYRQGLCSTSATLHDARQYRHSFDWYDSESDVRTVINMLCDRYASRQMLASIRLPRRAYYTSIELFTLLGISHTGLSSRLGPSMKRLGTNNSYQQVTGKNQSVPVTFCNTGKLVGEVIGISETGPFMDILIKTVSPYSAI